MSALVRKRRLMSWLNSVKVPVGVQGCRVLKMTTSLIWQGKREDLVDDWTSETVLIMSAQTRSYIYTGTS